MMMTIFIQPRTLPAFLTVMSLLIITLLVYILIIKYLLKTLISNFLLKAGKKICKCEA